MQGRLYRAPGEAVASQRLLDTVHLRVGEYIRMPVGGVPVVFHIVGRIIEPEYGGQVLAYGINTLTAAGAVPPPLSYSLVLRSGISPDAATAWLLRASRNRLDVVQAVNPAASLGIVRPMLAGLFVVLALIALTSLLTASAVGLRDHLRDVGALRAMGMTPRQVMSSLVTRTTVLALVGTAVGMIVRRQTDPASHRRGWSGLWRWRWPGQFPVGGGDPGGGRRRPDRGRRGRRHPGSPGG